MKFTLGEIAQFVKGELSGDPDTVITGASGIKEAKSGDITFLANSKYISLLEMTKASAVIVSKEIDNFHKAVIKTDEPSLSFAKVVKLIAPQMIKHPQGIHSTALISPRARLGKNVTVGAYAIIDTVNFFLH